MQKEWQNKQKEKGRIHKNDQVAPQARIPPNASVTWLPMTQGNLLQASDQLH